MRYLPNLARQYLAPHSENGGSPSDAGQILRRRRPRDAVVSLTQSKGGSAILLAALFWLLTFGILSVRGALVEELPFYVLAPRRVLVSVIGAALCYAASRSFDAIRFRSFAHRLAVGFSAALLMSVLLTAFHMAVYRVIFPVPAQPLSLNHALEWVITWLGYMMAWTGVQLAFLYHWEVNTEQQKYARLREMAQEAKIAALRYQINPHFLFNSLNSISALVANEDKDRAEQMIISLAEFFRATLLSSTSSLVCLGDEIDLQLLYLHVEEIRFGARMQIELKVDASALSAMVPPLILQPLVENAVRHGVECCEGVTVIELGAVRFAGSIQVYVQNRGCRTTARRERGDGIGLKNVHDRLMTQFGHAARLVTAADNAGTYRATITLPVQA